MLPDTNSASPWRYFGDRFLNCGLLRSARAAASILACNFPASAPTAASGRACDWAGVADCDGVAGWDGADCAATDSAPTTSVTSRTSVSQKGRLHPWAGSETGTSRVS